MTQLIGSQGDDVITPDLVSEEVRPGHGKRRPGDGADRIRARDGNDTVEAGGGDDRIFLGEGSDRFIWRDGDGSDTVHGGGAGSDRLEFHGSDGAERIAITGNESGRVRLGRDIDEVRLKLKSVEILEISTGGGADVLDAAGQLDPRLALRVTAGAGDDLAILGAGADSFFWNPGDGSDTVHGGAGRDTLVFAGSGAAEHMVLAAEGDGVGLVRDVGGIVMATTGIEQFEIRGGQGADRIEIGDLSGRGVEFVTVDAGGVDAADQVAVRGTAGDDLLHAADTGFAVSLGGSLPYAVRVSGLFGGDDVLELRPGAGSDEVDVSALGQDLARALIAIGTETSDGRRDLDVVVGFDAARGDAILLDEAGGYLDATVTPDGLLLTLGGADGDQLLLAGVTGLGGADIIL